MGLEEHSRALVGERLEKIAHDYEGWLSRQPLSANTRRTYHTRVRGFLGYLAATPAEYGDPLAEAHARDYAARDYKTHLKTVSRAKPSSVNLTLAAIDNFYRFMGMGKPDAKREDLPGVAPGALDPEEQKRFLRAVERCSSARDRAIARVLFFTGLRVSELVGLDTSDVALSARKGRVTVRSGKGDAYREVALNAEVRGALEEWLEEREEYLKAGSAAALFLNRKGSRLTTRAVDMIVRRFGEDAAIEKPVSDPTPEKWSSYDESPGAHNRRKEDSRNWAKDTHRSRWGQDEIHVIECHFL